MKLKYLFTFVIFFVLIALAAPVYAEDIPALPEAFYGNLSINGNPAPIGTIVEAVGTGVRTGIEGNPIITTVTGAYGSSNPLGTKLVVQGDIADGTLIQFYVNNVLAAQTAVWHSGTASQLNLTVTIAAPTITGISPNSGSTTGGTSVAISGTTFVSGATVTIGGAAATGVTVASTNSITAITPAGTTGLRDVVVTTTGGSATLAGAFTYIADSTSSGGASSGGGGAQPSTPTPTPAPVSGTGSAYVGGIITTTGVFTQSVTLQSSSGIATVIIAAGTTGTLNGVPLGTITVAPQSTPPPPTTSSNIIGVTYDFGPNGAAFNPPISMTISYDSANIPIGVSETSLVLAYYDTAAGQWVTIQDGVVDTIKHTITVPVSHFTLFTALAPFATPIPSPSPVPSPTPTPIQTTSAIVSPTSLALAPPSLTPILTPTTTVTPDRPVSPSTTPVKPANTFNWAWVIGIVVAAIVAISVMMVIRRRDKSSG